MRLSIEAPNAQAIAARLRRAPRTAADYIEKNLRGLGSGLVGQMRRELQAVKDTGQTDRSVSFAYGRSGDTWTLTVGPTAKQREVIRTGRRPGAKPPPIGPLKAWARRKLGDESAAYAIQKSIAKKGTSVNLTRLGIGEPVSGHGIGLNYPDRTLARPYTQNLLKRTGERIPLDLLAALEGGGK
jgi:hypothetical protein